MNIERERLRYVDTLFFCDYLFLFPFNIGIG